MSGSLYSAAEQFVGAVGERQEARRPWCGRRKRRSRRSTMRLASASRSWPIQREQVPGRRVPASAKAACASLAGVATQQIGVHCDSRLLSGVDRTSAPARSRRASSAARSTAASSSSARASGFGERQAWAQASRNATPAARSARQVTASRAGSASAPSPLPVEVVSVASACRAIARPRWCRSAVASNQAQRAAGCGCRRSAASCVGSQARQPAASSAACASAAAWASRPERSQPARRRAGRAVRPPARSRAGSRRTRAVVQQAAVARRVGRARRAPPRRETIRCRPAAPPPGSWLAAHRCRPSSPCCGRPRTRVARQLAHPGVTPLPAARTGLREGLLESGRAAMLMRGLRRVARSSSAAARARALGHQFLERRHVAVALDQRGPRRRCAR